MSGGTTQAVPLVYAGIRAVTAALARTGIAKSQVNKVEGYRYRSIDEVQRRLAPLLARHRLCVLPRVLEREARERHGAGRGTLASVCLKVAFDIVCTRDGSAHTIAAYGEALDAGDKATAKAMSAAWKQAILQVFCVPDGEEDADVRSPVTVSSALHAAEPVQGWEQWTRDICALVGGCVSEEAVERVQATYRHQLRALSKCRSDLFAAVGTAIAEQRRRLLGENVAESATSQQPAATANDEAEPNGAGCASEAGSMGIATRKVEPDRLVARSGPPVAAAPLAELQPDPALGRQAVRSAARAEEASAASRKTNEPGGRSGANRSRSPASQRRRSVLQCDTSLLPGIEMALLPALREA